MKDKSIIRILHISNGDDCLGSAQCLYEILKYELSCSNIEPVVLTPKYTGINEFCKKNDIENYVSKYCGFMYPMHDNAAKVKFLLRKAEYYLNKDSSLIKIKKMIDFKTIDIIHTNNSLNDIGRRLSLEMNIPHVWHLREGGLFPQNLHPYFKNFTSYMNTGNVRFIAVSYAVKKEWVKLGIPEKKIEVIYDGVSLPKKVYTKVPSNRIRFVMTGAYSEIKGQIQVIKAVAQLPEKYRNKIQVDFWGNGVQEYVEYLKAEINNNNLQGTIELKGFTNNVWETLSMYDVGLNCTRFEAFGRTTVEFLISGIPVIASQLGANLELINENNGLFYKYDNIDDLQHALEYMVDKVSNFHAENIANTAKRLYSCEISNAKIISFFKRVYKRDGYE